MVEAQGTRKEITAMATTVEAGSTTGAMEAAVMVESLRSCCLKPVTASLKEVSKTS